MSYSSKRQSVESKLYVYNQLAGYDELLLSTEGIEKLYLDLREKAEDEFGSLIESKDGWNWTVELPIIEQKSCDSNLVEAKEEIDQEENLDYLLDICR